MSRETEMIDGAGWYVEMPRRMPDFVFPLDEYECAFENATGVGLDAIDDETFDYPGEERIRLIDFGEPTEVPIYDV